MSEYPILVSRAICAAEDSVGNAVSFSFSLLFHRSMIKSFVPGPAESKITIFSNANSGKVTASSCVFD